MLLLGVKPMGNDVNTSSAIPTPVILCCVMHEACTAAIDSKCTNQNLVETESISNSFHALLNM